MRPILLYRCLRAASETDMDNRKSEAALDKDSSPSVSFSIQDRTVRVGPHFST